MNSYVNHLDPRVASLLEKDVQRFFSIYFYVKIDPPLWPNSNKLKFNLPEDAFSLVSAIPDIIFKKNLFLYYFYVKINHPHCGPILSRGSLFIQT